MTIVKNFFTYKAKAMTVDEFHQDAMDSTIDALNLVTYKGTAHGTVKMFTDPDETFQITVTSNRLEVVATEGEDKGHGLLLVELGQGVKPIKHIPGPWQVRVRNLLDN